MNRLSPNTKIMKFKTFIKLSALAVVLCSSIVGCRKGLERTTPLQGRGVGAVSTPDIGGPILPGKTGDDTIKPVNNDTAKVDETVKPTPFPTPPAGDPNKVVPLNGALSTWGAAADQPFKSDTVYFDYDKATLKQGEVSKVERVAGGIKGLAGKALRIEGHCDERGTEEYNRSLGERRAMAVRESLMRAGVDPSLIDTISYGEDRPADPGHNEAAWSKNRRGEFIVIEPPGASTSK